MSEIAISLSNVSKCYKRYSRPVERLKELLLPGKSHAENFWALRDINLEIAKGETLGIIGQNGSGKSTLLQIIAGTLKPTTGKVQVNGRVSALLELGSGFNPEFTGRQNVFFNGRILGLSREEIEAKFDDIAAFAEIGDFLDQPVKTYSSGMVVRLAFAVVANTEPHILIVDEALAVGDARFQARCMKRIRQLKEQGVTILFVSHDCSSVKMLCQHAALLKEGTLLNVGHPKDVVDHYIALLSSEQKEADVVTSGSSNLETSSNKQDNKIPRHGNKQAIIKSVKITDLEGREISSKVLNDSIFNIEVCLLAKTDLSDLVIGFYVSNLMGVVIYGTNSHHMGVSIKKLTQGQQMVVKFQMPCYFNKGVYTVTAGIHSEEGISYDWMNEVTVFEVDNTSHCIGLVDFKTQVKICELDSLMSSSYKD
jgi:lipopolysaccharide transport system ATP-binding protein